MTGPDEPPVPPEAKLIRQRREESLPRISHRKAAARAATLLGETFSAGTWQKLEAGDYRGGPDRIAVMAMVVGVTPSELERAGRTDAARLLRDLIEREAASEPLLQDVATSEDVMQLLLMGLEEIRQERRLTEAQRGELERQLIKSQLAHLQGQLDQIRTMLRISTDKGK